jgi:hypothetical protein
LLIHSFDEHDSSGHIWTDPSTGGRPVVFVQLFV